MSILINPLTRSDLYVYHYTTSEAALEFILKSGTLKLGPYSRVNDPRESKQWDFKTLVRADSNVSYDDYDRLSAQISERLKANVKLICFCTDSDEAVGKWQPEALLHRGFAKPSMWHQYGDKSRGICLVFNREKLGAAFSSSLDSTRLADGYVNYSNDGIVPRMSGYPFSINLLGGHDQKNMVRVVAEHLARNQKGLFFTKLSDWASEAEYRWVYWDSNPKPRHVKFNDALEAILVGEACAKNVFKRALRYCIKYRAELATLGWRNGFPSVKDLAQPYVTHSHLYQKGLCKFLYGR